ncbi:MAG: hypothetical protein KatS3mg052_2135 [Candidatus Roseilinea sp.]|nr:MAG: hypothetical protein KatS3mg052_2135 [Candidatus Roseilinea sp.]
MLTEQAVQTRMRGQISPRLAFRLKVRRIGGMMSRGPTVLLSNRNKDMPSDERCKGCSADL